MLSLGHSPSPIGLFFSVLNQLTSTSTFLSQGEMVVIPTKDFVAVGVVGEEVLGIGWEREGILVGCVHDRNPHS